MNKSLKIMLKSMALGLVIFVGLTSAEPINFISDKDSQSIVVDSDSAFVKSSPVIMAMLSSEYKFKESKTKEIHHRFSTQNLMLLVRWLSGEESIERLKESLSQLPIDELIDELNELLGMIDYYQMSSPELVDEIRSASANILKSSEGMEAFKENLNLLKESFFENIQDNNRTLVKKLLSGAPFDFEYLQTFDKNNGGHTSATCSISISPDESYFVSGACDQMIKVWKRDVSSNQFVLAQTIDRTNGGHDSSVSSISISADGSYFVSGSHDKTIKVWGFPAFLKNLTATQAMFILLCQSGQVRESCFIENKNSLRSIFESFEPAAKKYLVDHFSFLKLIDVSFFTGALQETPMDETDSRLKRSRFESDEK